LVPDYSGGPVPDFHGIPFSPHRGPGKSILARLSRKNNGEIETGLTAEDAEVAEKKGGEGEYIAKER